MAEIKNQASVTFNYTGVTGATAKSNISTIGYLGPITSTLKAYKPTYQLNKPIDLVYEIENTGANDLAAVTVTDNLGEYEFPAGTKRVPLTYVPGSAAYFINGAYKGLITPTIGSAVFALGTLKKGEKLTLVYQAMPNDYAYPPIITKAKIAATGITPIDVTNTLNLDQDYADITVEKTMTPNPVYGNSTLTYTFKLSNYGKGAAQEIVLSDDFEMKPTITRVMVGTVQANLGTNYKYANGVFEIDSIGPVPNPPALGLAAATITQDATTGKIKIVPTTLVITVEATIA